MLGFTFSSHAKPLKVYLLVGQSNMRATRPCARWRIWVWTQDGALLKAIRDDEPAKVHDQIWFLDRYLGRIRARKAADRRLRRGRARTKDRTELTFGITIQHVGEPILLIKTSWGGKSLNTDFRSPARGRINSTSNKSRI